MKVSNRYRNETLSEHSKLGQHVLMMGSKKKYF